MAWHIGTASMATNEHIRVERIGIGQCRLGFFLEKLTINEEGIYRRYTT